MGFDKKYENLLSLKPDIAVISECANLDTLDRKAPNFNPRSKIWIGDNPNKGIGIFTWDRFEGSLCSIHDSKIPYIVPIEISGDATFNLLAVWACHSKKNSYEGKAGPLARAIGTYSEWLRASPTVIAGDFNDNSCWDEKNKQNSHSSNVQKLQNLGLQSVYHFRNSMAQGVETEPTIYWRNRTQHGPRYHIDYCFIPNGWNQTSAIEVGKFADWVATGLSDHVPLIVELFPPHIF